MILFFCIALIIQPWIFIPDIKLADQFRQPQAIFMCLTFLGMISLYFLNGARQVYRNKYLAMLVGYILLHLFVTFIYPLTFDIKNYGKAVNILFLEPFIYVILGIFVSYIVLSYFQREDFVRVARALCLSGTLIASFAILQRLGIDPFGQVASFNCANQVSACLDNPNLVGNYLSLVGPLFFIFPEKRYLLGTFLVYAGIGVTHANFAVILALLGLFIFSLLHYKHNKYIICSLIVLALISVGLVFYLDLPKLNHMGNGALPGDGRLECWKQSFNHFLQQPLFGQGFGIFKTFKMKIINTYWFYAHNDWLERAIEIGLVGVLLVFLVVVNAIRNFTYKTDLNYSYFSMFIVFLVMMFGSFPFETATIALLGMISWWAVEIL